MPANIALAAIERGDEVDLSSLAPEVALAAEAFAKPATADDYRRLIDIGAPLPAPKFVRQPAAANRQGGGSSRA